AAAEYQRLIEPQPPNWSGFDEAGENTTHGTVSTEEHAQRAILLSLVSAQGGSAETIRKQFGNPNSLTQRMLELEPQMTVEGRDGVSPQQIRMAVLEKIARDMKAESQPETKPLFKKGR